MPDTTDPNELLRKHLAKQTKKADQERLRRAMFGPITHPDDDPENRPPEAA